MQAISTLVKDYGLRQQQSVTVAVIDGAMDVKHPLIEPHLWVNEKEKADGRDNDRNGLADDIHGWNWLSDSDGRQILRTGTEEYRQWKRLRLLGKAQGKLSVQDSLQMAALERKVHMNSYIFYAMNQHAIWQHVQVADSLMRLWAGNRQLTVADFKNIEVEDTTGVMDALRTTVMRLYGVEPKTLWSDFVSTQRQEAEVAMQRLSTLDTDDDAHRRVGNDPSDFATLTYGCNVLNPDTADATHATMVGGLLLQGAQTTGADLRLMVLRAVPDGDEYDRDVVAALHYAIKHGAKVVVMDLGKTYSPNRAEVDAALDLAARKDVLLVMPAGDKGKDNEKVILYPDVMDTSGHRRRNILLVGAHDEQGKRARFSNYGVQRVDILAPGTNLRSYAPEGKWDVAQGTSAAASVAASVAASLRAYFPELKAREVREIIMQSTRSDVNSGVRSGLLDAAEAFRRAATHELQSPCDAQSREREKITLPAKARVLNQTVDVKWLDKEGTQYWWERQVLGSDSLERTLYHWGDARTKRVLLTLADTTLHRLLTPYAREKNLPLKGHVYLSDMCVDAKSPALLYFTYNNHQLAYNRKTGTVSETASYPARNKKQWGKTRSDYWRKYSSDSLFCVYAVGHDLWMARMERNAQGLLAAVDSTRLTTDGEQYHSYSISGNSVRPVKSDNYSSANGKWMGDSHCYLLVREDRRDIGTLTLVNSLAEPRPKAETYQFAMPGDSVVAQFEMWMLDADKRQLHRVDIARYPDQMLDLPRFRGLTISGNNAYVVRKSRAQDSTDLLMIRPGDTCATTLIHEPTAPHLNEQLFSFHVLNEGKDILWWAERGDRGQWWLYDGMGRQRCAVTPPAMVAGEILRIDTLGRSLILRGYGREQCSNAAYSYYYKVGFNGRGLTLLTPGDGNHSIALSPGRNPKYLVDTYSRIDMAPVHRLRDMRGRVVDSLCTADVSALLQAGWRYPRQIALRAADDSTQLYGIVYTPWNMQPTDTLPVVSNPYPGPHTDLLPLSFSLDDNCNQTLANDGFVVLNYSYRGSNPWRGRKFYTHGYGNLRDYALDDDYQAIRQIASLIPQADTTRVGIWGHSGGGFMAAAAMLTRPWFYKTAVSCSGNHDNNIYTKWWGETFHGSQPIPTNMELADRLQGNLLLVHGDMDNNVHPASTLRMAHALIRANKRFDMLIIPGANHALGDSYFTNVVRAYLREHLRGEQIPTDIKNLK